MPLLTGKKELSIEFDETGQEKKMLTIAIYSPVNYYFLTLKKF